MNAAEILAADLFNARVYLERGHEVAITMNPRLLGIADKFLMPHASKRVLEITDPTTGFVTYVYHPIGPVSTNETPSDPTD